MPSLILVRHGQASFGGASYDVLSETGYRQAGLVADALRGRGVALQRVVSGSLKRQLDTAAPIAAAWGLDVEVDERWNEYSTGDILEHHSSTDAREERADPRTPRMSSRDFQPILEQALLQWIAAEAVSPADEPWPDFALRVASALDAALESAGRGATVVVVTSGGPIAACCSRLLETPPGSLVTFNRVAINGGMTTITDGRGGRTLISFNEHGHLQGQDAALLTYR